ncbi:MAG: flagellar filament capping protein FliD [Balneolaceae bacterium]|nr:flagellar filament capping protein FliD [Balneolaceae bacterium]
MATISSLFAQTSSYETFVTQLVEVESQKKLRYESDKSDVKESITAIGKVSKAITDFEAKIAEFTDASNNSFEQFTSTVSDSQIVKINSISALDRENTFNITVDRLAKKDVALDGTRTAADTDLAAFGDGEVTLTIGDKTETINVVTTKDEGSGPVSMTNQEILEAFATEIADKFGDEASANVFNTNSTDVQFSVQSLETGFDNRIQWSGATGVLAEITGGMTELVPDSELDSQFTIDGVTFTRGSNNVDDAIEGLDFTLLDATGTQEQMTVSRDIAASKSNLEDFIKAYNEVNETIRERTFINAETGNKGPLQKYRSVRNLSSNLRQTVILGASGIPSGNVANFSDLGITFENDGEMKIDDSDVLDDILQNRPEEIAAFFMDPTSPIATMLAMAESYTKSDGILSSLEDSLDDKVDNLDRLIEREEDYLTKYEEDQRRIFNELDALLEEGQQQFDQVTQFAASSFYY